MIGRGVSTSASFRRLIAEIPRAAAGVYYRDHIGNVSTSGLFASHASPALALLVLDLRYPLYGGWSTAWYQGWNVPAAAAGLTVDAATGEHTLAALFGLPFEEVWAEELIVKASPCRRLWCSCALQLNFLCARLGAE
jgi:Ribophorin I